MKKIIVGAAFALALVVILLAAIFATRLFGSSGGAETCAPYTIETAEAVPVC